MQHAQTAKASLTTWTEAETFHALKTEEWANADVDGIVNIREENFTILCMESQLEP